MTKRIITISTMLSLIAACDLSTGGQELSPDAGDASDVTVFERPPIGDDAIERDGVITMAPRGDDAGVCACDSDECTRAWTEENFGCGVCIVFDCGAAGSRGACVPCDDASADQLIADSPDRGDPVPASELIRQ